MELTEQKKKELHKLAEIVSKDKDVIAKLKTEIDPEKLYVVLLAMYLNDMEINSKNLVNTATLLLEKENGSDEPC